MLARAGCVKGKKERVGVALQPVLEISEK